MCPVRHGVASQTAHRRPSLKWWSNQHYVGGRDCTIAVMKIAYAAPLPSGNAAQIIITPQAGEVSWRVLRKVGAMDSTNFSGPDDPSAMLIHDGNSRTINDFLGLVNGSPHTYIVYPFDANGALMPLFAKATIIPNQDFEDTSVDVQEVVRGRIESVLTTMIAKGQLPITANQISVLSIPFGSQNTPIPIVTVLLGSDVSDTRAIGDGLGAGLPVDAVGWDESDGWLSRVSIDLCIWSLNPEERNDLRRAVKAAIVSSLGHFDDAGMVQIDLHLRDEEDCESMNAPLYKTTGVLSCLAPSSTVNHASRINTVSVQIVNPD